MKYFLFIIISIWASMQTFAQKSISDAESQRLIEQVCNAAENISSLQCDFRQEKHLSMLQTTMVSLGKMYYKGGKLLRWEYISPYTYTFILNNDKVMLKSTENTDVISVRSSKMFQQIARIMMNSITGRCLSDANDFNVTMYDANGKLVAKLIPQQKELAQLFDTIRLYIEPGLQMVTMVELVEKSGDLTQITMTNVEKNTTLNDALFTIK